MSSSDVGPESAKGRYLMTLSLTALGVVFGDIGTSPITPSGSPSTQATDSIRPGPTYSVSCR